ncbi:transcription factor ovo-like homolog lin-48 isoform X9 [Hydra vulgaris]|uniref:Transcription factor ovo-like homolog lin-48 isoform X9 n=1 Tax=Hydra vulgaris TaxID=6087 RepID=A0ABM4B5F8_HYDVU
MNFGLTSTKPNQIKKLPINIGNEEIGMKSLSSTLVALSWIPKRLKDNTLKKYKIIKLKLDSSNGVNNINIDEFNQYKLHEDNKAEIQRLINKNTSDIGNRMMSPSHMLNLPHNNQQNMMAMPRTPQSVPMSPNIIQQMRPLISSPQQFNSPQRAKVPLNFGNEMKQESEENKKIDVKKPTNVDSFDNPYVRIAYLCRVCGKEQSQKFKFDWKRHFLTHQTGSKAFQCEICGKSFAQNGLLQKHMKRHQSQLSIKQSDLKTEQDGFTSWHF